MTQTRTRVRWLLIAAAAAGVVVLDQITKTLAVRYLGDGDLHLFWTLRLHLSLNPGAAFSLGTGSTTLITIVAVAMVGVLLAFSRWVDSPGLAVVMGLILGGAVSNVADRLLRDHNGAVVDFIDLQWWPVFNVADMAITCGALALLLTGFRPAK